MASRRDAEDLRQTFCDNRAETCERLILSGGANTGLHNSLDLDVMFPAEDVFALTPEYMEWSYSRQTLSTNTLLWIHTTNGVH